MPLTQIEIIHQQVLLKYPFLQGLPQQALLQTLDSDLDGVITTRDLNKFKQSKTILSESTKHALKTVCFRQLAAIDQNRDGFVDRRELWTWAEKKLAGAGNQAAELFMPGCGQTSLKALEMRIHGALQL